jgi:CheY-like chemotaxis protein
MPTISQHLPRVLVVEDEPLIAMMMQEWLEELNCMPVGPATSVSGALELIGRGKVDGAILDVTLGSEQSFPVADELLKRGVPFAFATGHDIETLEPRFAGALILPKPFEQTAFSGVVGSILGQRGPSGTT